MGGKPGPLFLNCPVHCCLSSDESTLYVCDLNNHRIAVVDVGSGQQSRQIGGGRGNAPGQFDQPSSLALYDDRLLFVADYNNGRIQMFNATTGAHLSELSVDQKQGPADLALSSRRCLLYVTNWEQHCVDVIGFNSEPPHRLYVKERISSVAASDPKMRDLNNVVCLCVGGDQEQLLYCLNVHFEEGHRMLLCLDVTAPGGPSLMFSSLPEHPKSMPALTMGLAANRTEPRCVQLSPDSSFLFVSDGYLGRFLVCSALRGHYIGRTPRIPQREGGVAGFCFATAPKRHNKQVAFVCNDVKHRIDLVEVQC